MTDDDRKAYWQANLRLMAILLAIWALVSLVGSTLLVDQLNNVKLGSVPLGFWLGQQGSILTFVALIAVYVWRMEKLDKSYGIVEDETQVEAH